MGTKTLKIIGGFLFVLLLTFSGVLLWSQGFFSLSENSTALLRTPVTDRKVIAHLYFVDASGGRLAAEDRVFFQAASDTEYARRLIDALLEGPGKEGLRSLPEGTTLRSLIVSPEGVAFADFSGEIRKLHPGNAEAEAITVFSVTNTLVLNVGAIGSVRFLIEGQEVDTLAGHMDLTRPYKANMLVVR